MDHTDPDSLLAALAWQVELGVDEAICDEPLDRYNPPPAPAPASEQKPEPVVAPPAAARATQQNDEAMQAIAQANMLAAGCNTLAELHATMAQFEGCALRQGARNFVFCDGHPNAQLMIIGEAPGRDEDRVGRPFVGRSGQLLDRMMAAIGRDRQSEAAEKGVYITNVLPWRPPANRDPSKDEMAMMKPFLLRHIALAKPDCLLLLGNSAMKTLFETSAGITATRGQWRDVAGIATIASFHPAALLRNGLHKKSAWEDLLQIRAKLDPKA